MCGTVARMATLHTEKDIRTEEIVINRVVELLGGETKWYRFPPFSFCDYILCSGEDVVMAVEVKVRKESMLELKQYPEGLWLRLDKYEKLKAFAESSTVKTIIVFAFNNGEGDLRFCEPQTLTHIKPFTPKPRLNGRDAPGDFAPVIGLDWDLDLTKKLPLE